jgi:uncharacterized membrane protein
MPRFSHISKALLFITVALYPAFIFYFLVIRKIPLRLFSLFIIAFALLAFIVRTSAAKGVKKSVSWVWTSLLLLGVGVLCFITNSPIILKCYPLLMNILFLIAFGVTCFSPPSMIFRFATIQDKSIKGSLGEKSIAAYCRKVTIAWCVFFIFNGSIAALTIFYGSDVLWSVYNGGISYILTGVFFMVELFIRKMVQKKIPKSGFDSLDNVTVMEKTEYSVDLGFSIPDTSPYFNGHFPDFPILPAVAQMEIALRFASRYLGTGVGVSEIRRIKFTVFVRPFTPLRLKLVKTENTLSFNIRSPEGETVYSTGTVVLENA